jgi:dCTP deaminase
MSVYSDTDVEAAIVTSQIIVHPLIKENIRGSSVDVTLGEWFYTTEPLGEADFYNPFDEADVKRYFGKPKQAVPNAEWCAKHNRHPFKGIPDDHPIIVLRPGQRILAHTHEFIGILGDGTTEMKARSSTGRNGIDPCFAAGWGDPNYFNRWTMEICNLNQSHSVPLPIGERIAQIIFHGTGPVKRLYGSGGKYQSGHDLREIVTNWKPEQMLPRSYLDERRMPLPIDFPKENQA